MVEQRDDLDGTYASIVGARLRAVRKQKRLSLQAVAQASEQEFKASVLGAYERGERSISVPRLQRLARFYSVPVDQLLPKDEGPDFGNATANGRAQADDQSVREVRQRLDLAFQHRRGRDQRTDAALHVEQNHGAGGERQRKIAEQRRCDQGTDQDRSDRDADDELLALECRQIEI